MALKLKYYNKNGALVDSVNFQSSAVKEYSLFLKNNYSGLTEYIPLSDKAVGDDSLATSIKFINGTKILYPVRVKQVIEFDIDCIHDLSYTGVRTDQYGSVINNTDQYGNVMNGYDKISAYYAKASNVTLRYNGGPYAVALSNGDQTNYFITNLLKTETSTTCEYTRIEISPKSNGKYDVVVSSQKDYDIEFKYLLTQDLDFCYGCTLSHSYVHHNGNIYLNYKIKINSNTSGLPIKINYCKNYLNYNHYGSYEGEINIPCRSITSSSLWYWPSKQVCITYGCDFDGLDSGDITLYIGTTCIYRRDANVHMNSREGIGYYDRYGTITGYDRNASYDACDSLKGTAGAPFTDFTLDLYRNYYI